MGDWVGPIWVLSIFPTGYIAYRKGRILLAWLWIGILLGPIGLILVSVVSDKKKAAASPPASAPSQGTNDYVSELSWIASLSPRQLNHEFADAMEYEDVPRFRKYLSHGADISTRTKDGVLPLNFAVGHGGVDLVREVLLHGPDINAKSSKGYTALMSAARVGDIEVVNLLLNLGADITATTVDGFTVLMSGASSGNLEVVKALLAAGADPLAKTSYGSSAVSFARKHTTQNGEAVTQHSEVVDLLEATMLSTRKCPYCTKLTKRNALNCEYCQKDLTRPMLPGLGNFEAIYTKPDGTTIRESFENQRDINMRGCDFPVGTKIIVFVKGTEVKYGLEVGSDGLVASLS